MKRTVSTPENPAAVLDEAFVASLFPPGRDDAFFEALYGGAEEGAFDISLGLSHFDEATGTLHLEFRLTERPGKCLACNLTYGLPEVFQRHPVIGLPDIVQAVEAALAPHWRVASWELGRTRTVSRKMNVIPLFLRLEPAA